MDEKAFLLYSADFSGIQKFIYTVASEKALRSLRSRSFFLELAMEHYADRAAVPLWRRTDEPALYWRRTLLYAPAEHCGSPDGD